MTYVYLLIPAKILGAILGRKKPGALGGVLALLLPVLGLFLVLMYYEYVVPYREGDASLWPIALMYGGALSAAASGAAFLIAGRRGKRKP